MTDNTATANRLFVRYTDPDGKLTELALSDKPITIGRSPDADIITLDERASRMHCGIRIWDGEYYIKDLKSKNGTYLNNQRVEMAKIKPGDKIRLGNCVVHVDDKKSAGTDTTVHSVQDEMDGGKGYKTILREIVQNTEKPVAKPVAKPAGTAEDKPAAKPLAKPVAKPVAKPASTPGSIEFDTPTKKEETRSKTAKLVSPPPEESKDNPSESKMGTGSKVVRRKPPTAIKIKRN